MRRSEEEVSQGKSLSRREREEHIAARKKPAVRSMLRIDRECIVLDDRRQAKRGSVDGRVSRNFEGVEGKEDDF